MESNSVTTEVEMRMNAKRSSQAYIDSINIKMQSQLDHISLQCEQ